MDRLELPSLIIQELSDLFKEALQAAAPALLTADLAGVERGLQQLSRQVMGQVVEHLVAARVAAADPAPPACLRCGRPTRCAGRARPRQLQGLVGDFTLRRPYFVCAACHVGHAPLDAALGLDGSALAPALGRVVCRAGLEDAFGAATDHLAETLGIVVPEEAVRRLTEGVGAVAEAAQQALIAQAQRGAPIAPLPPAADALPPPALVVELDGLLALHHDGTWHEVKVSRVAPLGPGLRSDPDTGRTHLALGPSCYGAGVEPSEAAWWRAHVLACQLGLGARVRLVVVLADGAAWIWTQAQRFLALAGVEVIEIVDIYHAYGHLWEVGNAVFGPGTPAAAWVEPLKDQLYQDGAPAVLAALAALTHPAAAQPAGPAAAEGTATVPVPPLSDAAAEAVRLAEGYFTTHAARMDYPRFVARQLPIGSGAVESAGKQLVTHRAKQAGMRWSAAGLQGVLSLRALHRSGGWAAFWQTQPQRRRPPVGRRPGATPPPAAPSSGGAPVPPRPPGALSGAERDQDWVPAGRHDAPPTLPPTPTPVRAPGPTRPAATHPWRRRFRPLARSA
jgi:hypothetical protein